MEESAKFLKKKPEKQACYRNKYLIKGVSHTCNDFNATDE